MPHRGAGDLCVRVCQSENIEDLLGELRAMCASTQDGSFQFGPQGLPLMRVVKQHSESDLRWIRMLYDINQTQRSGLDINTD